MKVGIVVPYSWSFWGAVVEHAELQAAALRRLGIETRTIMGNDPPGSFTRALHPRLGRHGDPPADVIPVGRSVIVPANGSLPNIVLSPSTVRRIGAPLEREHFDLVHVHEPMTPVIGVATLALRDLPDRDDVPCVRELKLDAARRAALGLPARPRRRAHRRLRVGARDSAQRYAPGDYEVIPNGVLIPPEADPGDRDHTVVFVGRHEPRKGLAVLLRAWPEMHARTARGCASSAPTRSPSACYGARRSLDDGSTCSASSPRRS